MLRRGVMRLDRQITIVLALVAAGCAGTGPYGSRGGGSYGGDPYYSPGLSRHEARVLTEQQALEERRLQRLQRERRENLLERQDRRRDNLEAAANGTTMTPVASAAPGGRRRNASRTSASSSATTTTANGTGTDAASPRPLSVPARLRPARSR